jgi:hypothetical protein
VNLRASRGALSERGRDARARRVPWGPDQTTPGGPMGPPRTGRVAPQEGGLHREGGELAARGGGERGDGVEGGDGLIQLRGDATALQRVKVRAREREEVRVVRVGAHGAHQA